MTIKEMVITMKELGVNNYDARVRIATLNKCGYGIQAIYEKLVKEGFINA